MSSKDNPKKHKKRLSMYSYVGLVCIIMVLIQVFAVPFMESRQAKTVEYSHFIEMIEQKKIDKVKLNLDKEEILFTEKTNDGKKAPVYKTGLWPGDTELIKRLEASGASFNAEFTPKSSPAFTFLFTFLLPIVLLVALGFWLNKRLKEKLQDGPSMTFGGGFESPFGGGGAFGKSGAKIVADTEVGVCFKDVAGQDEAKEALTEIVDFLHNPKRYDEIGAKLPKGALLVGPPGTGKTLLAKAVAGEAKVPFFSISGSEFVEMFVGRGAAKVRDLFKQASEKAPCIIFIDEIDTVGKRRDSSLVSNDEREQTLNQLLSEMDGFENKKGIVVLGATNRPETLDPALLRPGRFDRRIPVELPDLAGREAILRLHDHNIVSDKAIDYELVARSTPGASGADLANIINEAALRAVRMKRKVVLQEDVQEAIELVIAGQQRKSTVLSALEKKIVAYHEIGHALVAAKTSHKAPVTKITIVPRTSGALGYTMQVDEGETFLLSKTDALNKIKVLCAGRAAEELIFNEVTTGATNDIEKATELARNMIARFGMSDKFGMVAFGNVRNKYLGAEAALSCSEGMALEVDTQVIQLIEGCYNSAKQILKENKFKLHELAAYLIRKETITGEEFMSILTRDEEKFRTELKPSLS